MIRTQDRPRRRPRLSEIDSRTPKARELLARGGVASENTRPAAGTFNSSL
ncbi:hypothetical protein [Streptomyces sp. A0642]|nr:hypothetical protein [Streptomyces sp. A0642]